MNSIKKELIWFVGWTALFMLITAFAEVLIGKHAHAGGNPQVVIFNPPVGDQLFCVMTSFQYLNGVLRLGTSTCVSDRVFGNGFEGG
jgi:hypothetical protein